MAALCVRAKASLQASGVAYRSLRSHIESAAGEAGAAGGAEAAAPADPAPAVVGIPSSTRHALTPANIVRVSEARRGEFICANLPAGRAQRGGARAVRMIA